MNNITFEGASCNRSDLLLNLYLREYQNWYYLNIVPKYDVELAAYMENQPETEFVRITLERAGTVIYYPIRYLSTCSFHVFGTQPACRKDKGALMYLLSAGECMDLILREITGMGASENISYLLDGFEDRYRRSKLERKVRELPHFDGYGKYLIAEADAKADKKLVRIENLFNEFGDRNDARQLYHTILYFVEGTSLLVDEAVQVWLKAYAHCLLRATLGLYLNDRVVVAANYRHAYLECDEAGLPVGLFFSDETNAMANELCLPNEGQGPCSTALADTWAIQAFLLDELLTEHCFPLVRNMAMLGLHTEEKLLAVLSDVFMEVRASHKGRADFLDKIKIEVPCYLEHLLPMEGVLGHVQKCSYKHNHLINATHYSKALIKPVPNEILHKRYFERGELEVALRAFDMEADIPVMHEWVNLDYSKKFWQMDGPIENLEEAYIKHLGVDYSHPYIGLINREPAFTIELYWAIKDEVGKYYPFQAGDYGFHMLIAPAKKRIPNFSLYALATCMEYFFSHSSVNRMIGEADVNHQGTHNLITKVGCEFDRALALPYKTSNLTFCTREQFHNATDELLKNSRQEILMNI